MAIWNNFTRLHTLSEMSVFRKESLWFCIDARHSPHFVVCLQMLCSCWGFCEWRNTPSPWLNKCSLSSSICDKCTQGCVTMRISWFPVSTNSSPAGKHNIFVLIRQPRTIDSAISKNWDASIFRLLHPIDGGIPDRRQWKTMSRKKWLCCVNKTVCS